MRRFKVHHFFARFTLNPSTPPSLISVGSAAAASAEPPLPSHPLRLPPRRRRHQSYRDRPAVPPGEIFVIRAEQVIVLRHVDPGRLLSGGKGTRLGVRERCIVSAVGGLTNWFWRRIWMASLTSSKLTSSPLRCCV